MEGLRQTGIPSFYELYRTPCPVCNKTGGCMIHENGNMVVCIRLESDRVFSKNFQSWIHYLERGVPVSKVKGAAHQSREKFNDEVMDMINRKVINDVTTELISKHRNHFLESRALTLEQINVRGYRSAPYAPTDMAKNCLGVLAERMNRADFKQGMPGFYLNTKGQWDYTARSGILIPYRNAYNEIVGFQTRQDEVKYDISYTRQEISSVKIQLEGRTVSFFDTETGEVLLSKELQLGEECGVQKEGKATVVKLKKGQRYVWVASPKLKYGAGAGNPLPVHVSVPASTLAQWEREVFEKKTNGEEIQPLKREALWITEGALKADCAVDHIAKVFKEDKVGDTILAVPGINSWRTILPVLTTMRVKRVTIAFDMDAITNDYVKHSYKALVHELASLGYEVYVALWPVEKGKGIDDVLKAGFRPILKRYA